MLKLPGLHPSLALALLSLEPDARGFAPIARPPLHILREDHLVAEVVAHYPLVPHERHPIRVLFQTRKNPRRPRRSRWRRVEDLPAVAGKIDFHPTVRITGAHDIVATEVVVFAGKEAVDFARRDAEGSQQNGHSRSEVLAMAGSRHKKKMRQRIVAGLSR